MHDETPARAGMTGLEVSSQGGCGAAGCSAAGNAVAEVPRDRFMPNGPKQNVQAGGFLLAFFILAGAIFGVALGEPSLGVLTGAGLGLAAALLIWLRSRS